MALDMNEKLLGRKINEKWDNFGEKQIDVVDVLADEIMEDFDESNVDVRELYKSHVKRKITRKAKAESTHVPDDNQGQYGLSGMDSQKWRESGQFYDGNFVKNKHARQKDNMLHMEKIEAHFDAVNKSRSLETKRFMELTSGYSSNPDAANNGDVVDALMHTLDDAADAE